MTGGTTFLITMIIIGKVHSIKVQIKKRSNFGMLPKGGVTDSEFPNLKNKGVVSRDSATFPLFHIPYCLYFSQFD